MDVSATATGAEQQRQLTSVPRGLRIALDAMSCIAHAGILLIVFHSFSEFMYLARSPNTWYIAFGLIIATWAMVTYWKYTRYLVLAPVVGLPAWFVLLARYRPEYLGFTFEFMRRWIEFLRLSYLGELQVVPPDLGFFSIWLVMLVAGVGGWVAVQRNTSAWVLAPGLSVLVFQWFFHFDPAQRYLSVFLVAAVILIAALQYRNWLSQVKGAAIYRLSLGSAIVTSLLVLVLVLSAVSVVQEDMHTWRLAPIRQWFTAQFPILDQLRGEAGTTTEPASWFSMGMSGYGSSSELGGPLELDDTPAFRARITPDTADIADVQYPLYFRGRTLTQYTGQGWLPDGAERWEWYGPDERLERAMPGDVRTQNLTAEIEPMELETNTIFAPGDARELGLADETKEVHREGGEVMAKSARGDVIAYSVIRSGQTYEASVQVPLWNIDADEIADESIDADDKAPYLQLPEEVPDRVHDLAREITEDAEGAYAKARAINDHLRDLPYSLNVSQVPADAEFTDHFLFEEQTGYCTYHSTAMAVLLRSVGIPTRWVQGFVVSRGDMERDEDAEELTGEIPYSQAHAWVEVWIPDHGWVAFEATPAYPGMDHEHEPPEHDVDTDTDRDAPPPDLDGMGPDGEMYEEELNDMYGEAGEGPPGPWDPRQLLPLLWATIGLITLCCLSIFALVRVRDRQISRALVQSVLDDSNDQNASRLVGAAATAFDYLSRGLQIPLAGSTPRELARIATHHCPEAGQRLEDLVELYERIIYANSSPDEKAAARAVKLRNEILHHIRRELGIPRYIGRIFLQQLPVTTRIALMRR